MTELELGWVAGFLEGEGCFYSALVMNKGSKCLVTRVTASSTDEDILRKIEVICGGKTGGPYRSFSGIIPNRKENKKVWAWNLHGQKAVCLMEAILPYMGERRSAKIEKVIKAYKESYERRQEFRRNNGRKQTERMNLIRREKLGKKRKKLF